MIKTMVGMPFAALMTAVLFLLMYGLTKPAEVVVTGTPLPPVALPIVPPDTKVETALRPSAEVALPDLPPIIARDLGDALDGPVTIVTTPGPATIDLDDDFSTDTSGGLMVISQMAPPFPANCQARGTEGFATVRFDVTLRGQVVNAEVVGSSHRCFERAALTAMRNWRYRPAMTTREGYIARGETKRFAFELAE